MADPKSEKGNMTDPKSEGGNMTDPKSKDGTGKFEVREPVVMNLPVPALKMGERIEDWQPLFQAAVATLCARGPEGEQLAVGMLPAYLNRRPAERELVKEIVKAKTTLADAFATLTKTLDPPLDKYECMQKLCRQDWVPGVEVDDFYYQLCKVGVQAQADFKFVLQLFVSQMPKDVQAKAKAWLADQESVTEIIGRCLLAEIKGWLVERGVPLDRGSRNFVGAVGKSSYDLPYQMGGAEKGVGPNLVKEDESKCVDDSRVFTMRQGKGRERRCYICNSEAHLMRNCPDRHCPKCGKKGHTARNCSARPRVYSVAAGFDGGKEEAVTLRVQFDRNDVSTLLDSGAALSVVDERTVQDLNLSHKVTYVSDLTDSVIGVGGEVPVIGELEVVVDAGDGQRFPHVLRVTAGDSRIAILGRDFLGKFPSTEFDWRGGRIRLGNCWKTPDVMIRGGEQPCRVAVAALECSELPSVNDIDARINPDLPQQHRQMIRNVLCEMKSVFAVDPKKPARTNAAEHRIVLEDDRPVKHRSARMSPRAEEEVQRQLEEMLKNNICRPSDSPWSSRVILVRKKDSTWRFVVDYRDLNQATVKDAYPAANCQDLLDSMHGSKMFSFLDCASAYWSVPIREEDKAKTAFAVPKGLYEMNVMAYGLCNSQSTYQRVVDEVLKGVPQVVAYVDDLCVHTADMEEHSVRLRETLRALSKANIQLRLDKCKFGFYSGEFVGHEVSEKGYRPLSCHVETIKAFPRPTTKKELQRFLGLVNYYRQFVKGMATTAGPLYGLTAKDARWEWTQIHEDAFNDLRSALTGRPLLAFPQWTRPFWVEVDGSASGVGGILSQVDEGGARRPVAYFSSALGKAQSNYSASELECWALVAAVRKWSKYLQAAAKVVLLTDHNPLTWLRKQRDPRHKFARWLMELESLRYEIVYRAGSDNTAADCLSRAPLPEDRGVSDEAEHFERHVYRIAGDQELLLKLKASQNEDRATSFAMAQLKANGHIDRGRYRHYNNMTVRDGVLTRGHRLIVPPDMQREITDKVHRTAHAGVAKTVEMLRVHYYWVGMMETVRSVCKECLICGSNKRSHERKVDLQPFVMGQLSPRNAVAMDVGTLPWSEDGYRYFLVIVDLFTRFVELVPLRDQRAETISEAFLGDWVYRHGLPKILVTDQAHNMDGSVMTQLCEQMGIDKRRSSPYHPEGDGLAERCIQSAKQLLRCMLAEKQMKKTDWPKVMKEASFALNCMQNSSTRLSPHEIMYGVKLNSPYPPLLSTDKIEAYVEPQDWTDERNENLARIHGQARAQHSAAQEERKRWHDAKTVPAGKRNIHSGDYIMLKNEERKGLDPLYSGPYRVIESKGANACVAIGNKTQWVHLNRCKKQSIVASENEVGSGESDSEEVVERQVPDDVGREDANENADQDATAVADEDDGDQVSATATPAPAAIGIGDYPNPLSFLPASTRSGRIVRRNPKYD